MNEPWILRREFDLADNRGTEGLFTLGNGYLHLRGCLEEHLSDAPAAEPEASHAGLSFHLRVRGNTM